MRRVVSFLCLLTVFLGACACSGSHGTESEPDTQGIHTTTAPVEGPSFSMPFAETELPPTSAETSDLSGEEYTEPHTTGSAAVESTEEKPTESPLELVVSYIGPERYEMERVEIADLRILVMQDGEILEENPAGWTADLTKLLQAGENRFEVAYKGMTAQVVVTASEGMKDGNTICRPGTASGKKLSGQKPLVAALKYLSVAYEPETTDPLSVMALKDRELTLTERSALFVREIYGQYDIHLPYTPEECSEYGAGVDREQVRVGDLVRFTDMNADGEDAQTLLGIYVGGDFVLSLNSEHKADFYWMHETSCRRLFNNTCELSGEESFVDVIEAFKKQKIYGEWVTSYVDDVPFMIGRIKNFYFTVDLDSCTDGYYPTFFCYDVFNLPEVFVEQWKKQYLKKNALCEVMKNGEYIRFDADGNYHFKVDCDRETWKSLTPGVYGEYWNMDWSFLRN